MKELNPNLKLNFVHLHAFIGVFVLSLFMATASFGQVSGTLPWVEDFDLPDKTQVDAGPTAWTAERDTLPFWVEEGQFVIYDDIGSGDVVGTFTTGEIDISSAQSVTVTLDVSASSGLDDGQDYVKLYAIVDGGDPMLLDSVDAYTHEGLQFAVGEVVTLRGGGISGSTLQLMIKSFVSFNTEFYYMDDLSVKEQFDWVEDFDLPDKTQVDNGPTAWTAERDTLPFWVEEGRFVIYDDIGSGDIAGTLTTEVLDISRAASVAVSLDVSASEGLDTGQDYVKLYAIVDGGEPMILDSVDAYTHNFENFSVGEVVTLTGSGIVGSTLQLVIKSFVSFNTEFYYMDNLSVKEQFAWVEDFDLPDSLQVDNGPTAWTAERGDGMPFWTLNGQFIINDDNGNDPVGALTTEVMDISLSEKIMVTLDVSTSDGLDNGQDFVKLYAIVDGADTMLLDMIDAYTVQGKAYAPGEVVTLTGRGITGKTLQVMVTAYLSASSEWYYMDNLTVQLETVQTYELSTSATNGSIALDPPGGIYEKGTEVTVTAIPDFGYYFDGWGGDFEGIEETTVTVVMDSSISVSVVFPQSPTYTLSTNVANGNIVLSPPGGTYFEGQVVIVNAKPYVGYEFVEWTGDLTGSENPTTLLMDADKSVTAVIQEIPAYSLSASGTNGSVSVSPLKDTYDPGEAVIIYASANEGYRFAHWDGDLTGTENPTSILMTKDYNIVAVFELIPPSYTLTIEAENGSVTLDPPGGIYEEGSEVTLTAVPDEGYQFVEWGGAASGSDNPVTITIDGDMTISVVFSEASAIEEMNSALSLAVYPNPAVSELHVKMRNLGDNMAEIILRDIVGRAAYHQLHSDPDVTIEVSSLEAGIYFIQIKSGDQMITRKLNIAK